MCVKFYLSTMRSDQCGTYGQFWSGPLIYLKLMIYITTKYINFP